MRNLLENMEGTKVGVIQNELGKISIDGTVLQNNDIQMVELNRGSIFCSCLSLSFVDALVQMSQKRFGIRVCGELWVWRSVQCGRNSCGDGSDGSWMHMISEAVSVWWTAIIFWIRSEIQRRSTGSLSTAILQF